MLPKRRGFTLVEAMTTVLVVSTLARIAVPNFQEMKLKARAAEVIAAVRHVSNAAAQYNAENHAWPEDAWPGEVPPELTEYVDGVRFDREGYRLDWENWRLPDGLPEHPDTRVLLGVTVVTENPELGNAVVQMLGANRAHFTMGDSYTFVLDGM